ncbi:MAG: translation initiation factor IF-2 [Spirochaetales bacterium]|nr:translation initiation factor IF-2 [Spirochaetales bacterium]
MAEEQEKQKKPKTTLIKHRRKIPTDTIKDDSLSVEKKKVVVVKKKVVKVKKKTNIVPVKFEKDDQKNHIKKSEETINDRVDQDNRTSHNNDNTTNQTTTTQNTTTTDREHQKFNKDKSKDSAQKPWKKESFKPKQGGTKNNFKKDTTKSFNPKKKPEKKEVSTAAGAKEKKKETQGKKYTGRRFYFTKKKKDYQKRKFEEHQEKITIVKKKSTQKANPIPKEISIMEVIRVSELAKKMNLKASELISKLMGMGMMVTINERIDAETVTLLADEYDCKVNLVSLYDETVIETEEDADEDKQPRPPVITVMGHVDHGKTKLLDAIRTAKVADSEFGGITQHIGAYQVQIKGHTIVFLDTPGHEAFTLMRARGAQLTDIVILVVAANDGVMPQTIEAINHAKAANVPIMVAINKIDLPDANIDKVMKQLADFNLMPEDWGGHTLFNQISALKKEGIDSLLDNILLQAEMLELKSNYNCRAQGKVIESKIDKGRGIVATVLIERGTLSVSDSFVAGVYPGKVRAMFNDKGEKIQEVTPGLPAEIIGFTGIPDSGDPFQVTENEKTARIIGTKRQELKKMEEAKNLSKVTLENLYDKFREGEIKELKVIIKGDVHGSVEALSAALEKLSTDEIKLVVINALAGAINESDINLASASNAIVIGFHVRPSPAALILAEREKVEVRKYNVIYDAIEDIRKAMEGLLSPEYKEEVVGTVEVRQVFKVPKLGTIAGCYVLTGKVKRGGQVSIVRDAIEIYRGKITSLKRFKDDAKEVETGFECGIGVENFNDLKIGDILEVIEIKEFAKTLD